MNMTIILLVLFLQIMSIRPFDCSDIIIEAQCDLLITDLGCIWNSNDGICVGSWDAYCPSLTCLYVDPASQTGISDGSFANPFTSIDEALVASSMFFDVEIVLINNDYDKVFQLKNQYQVHELPFGIKIR